MFEISFAAFGLFFTAVWLACRIAVWIRRRHIDWKREAALLLMYLNLALILRFTFFPRALADGHVKPLLFDAAKAYPFRIHLLPLAELVRYGDLRHHIWNVGGNIALFIPSGILLPTLYKKLNGFWKTVAAGALISLCVELLQLPLASRATDIDDLILNTVGVMLGYGICALLRAAKKQTRTA